MRLQRRTFLQLLSASLATAALSTRASGADFPARSIRLIVPFPAGGPTDIIARLMAQSMSESLGQPVIIENKGGAGGVVGTDVVAKAAPDGYTLALSSAGALSISPSLQKMPYQSTVDLKPITLVAKMRDLLVVPASSPAKSLADFIGMAKTKPGSLNYGSTGLGSMPQLAAERVKAAANIDIVHVPYSGAAPAVTDLLGGRTDMFFADMPVLLPHIKAGTLRALAVGSRARVQALPDVPTLIEQGLPDVVVENWYGLVAPAGTPPDIVARILFAAQKAISSEQVRSILIEQGMDLVGNSPDEFNDYIESETKKWGELIRNSGIKLE